MQRQCFDWSVWSEEVGSTRFRLPCESRNLRSGTSLSKSTCRSTPRSRILGDKGAEVQEVEGNASSRNGEPAGWGGNGSSCESDGPTRDNNNQTAARQATIFQPKLISGFFLWIKTWTELKTISFGILGTKGPEWWGKKFQKFSVLQQSSKFWLHLRIAPPGFENPGPGQKQKHDFWCFVIWIQWLFLSYMLIHCYGKK